MTAESTCPCQRVPDPGVCSMDCASGRKPGGHCRCAHLEELDSGEIATSFDWVGFRAAIAAVIELRGFSDRDVARQAQIAPSTITRAIRQGETASVANVAKLADWARLPLDAFVQRRRPIVSPMSDKTRATVAALRASEAAAAALRSMLGQDAT